jgi:NADPH oxidase 2
MADMRADGLDFADRNLMDHPDVQVGNPLTRQPSHLQRNKTERQRLQGLQRVESKVEKPIEKAVTWKQRFDVWMINEGGRQLFFATFIFFHILVGALGYVHYQTKDNLTFSRRTFGQGFSQYFPPFCLSNSP